MIPNDRASMLLSKRDTWCGAATQYNKSRQLNHLWLLVFNTLGPGQNGHTFPEDMFKYIFLNENI